METKKLSHSRKPLTDKTLQQVAKIYNTAKKNKKPTQEAIAKAYGITRSGASTRIKLARKHGYLPHPTKTAKIPDYDKWLKEGIQRKWIKPGYIQHEDHYCIRITKYKMPSAPNKPTKPHYEIESYELPLSEEAERALFFIYLNTIEEMLRSSRFR